MHARALLPAKKVAEWSASQYEIVSLSGAGDDARYFQISLPAQPGNSSGSLVGEHGNEVGVVSAKLSARATLAASGSLPDSAISPSHL
jgi:S1-C subfamily serine protease